MASEIKVDTISEKTSGNGIAIDSVVHKDSAVYPSSADGGALGSASNEWSDLFLADSSVIKFGADQDTTLTHTDGTGLTLNSTNKLCFNDASQFIQGSSATVLSIGATDEIDLTATAIDINGTADISGTTTLGGTLTVNAGAIFNEASADVDFRVESNGDANMFVVDGGSNEVNIGGAADLTNGQKFNLNGTYSSDAAGPNMMFFGTATDAFPSLQILNYSHDDISLVFDGFHDGNWKSSDAGSQFTITKRSDFLSFFADDGIAAGSTVSFVERFRMATDGTLTATDTSIGSLSDSRLKTNIQDFTYSLDVFKGYQAKIFDWKNPDQHGNKSQVLGFLAQDVEVLDNRWVYDYKLNKPGGLSEVDPDLAHIDEDGIAKASKLEPRDVMYISVIQQLITKIETLEAKVTALEG